MALKKKKEEEHARRLSSLILDIFTFVFISIFSTERCVVLPLLLLLLHSSTMLSKGSWSLEKRTHLGVHVCAYVCIHVCVHAHARGLV